MDENELIFQIIWFTFSQTIVTECEKFRSTFSKIFLQIYHWSGFHHLPVHSHKKGENRFHWPSYNSYVSVKSNVEKMNALSLSTDRVAEHLKSLCSSVGLTCIYVQTRSRTQTRRHADTHTHTNTSSEEHGILKMDKEFKFTKGCSNFSKKCPL